MGERTVGDTSILNAGSKSSSPVTSGGFIPLSALDPTLPAQGAPAAALDMEAVRRRLAGSRGRQYWRSLEELSGSEEFHRYLEKEFPHQAPREMAPLGRREFFRLMGATLALAGVGGCAYQPPENIVPYVNQPEMQIPGRPMFYTTAFTRGGYAYGVLGESHMGRPVKLEGNPEHPASLGATDAFTQASLLSLYDPDRSQAVRQMGDLTSWDVFLGWMTDQLDGLRAKRGAGLRLLTETITSPTLADQLRRFLAMYPEARVHQHEPAGADTGREGARLAFGDEAHPIYHFDRAERVLSLDSNFLVDEPGSVRYAREFVDGRRVRQNQLRMNRLYVVESTPTITGSYADHRLPLKPSLIEGAARAVAAGVGAPGSGGAPPGVPAEWIAAVVKDLQGHRGTSLVIAGRYQSLAVHALAHAMNQALGNVGKTVTYTAPVEAHFGAREGTLRELVDDMDAGRVGLLLILGGNPVYDAPADIPFYQALQKVPQRVHLGLYEDETAVQCQWHIPESHYLEAWSDARAFDGTASFIQPLITPLYESHSAHELLAAVMGEGDRNGYDIVRDYWQAQKGLSPTDRQSAAGKGVPGAAPTGSDSAPSLSGAASAFEKWWRQALIAGVIPGTAAPAKPVTLKAGFAAPAAAPAAGGMEILFRPDPTVWDGRYANNGWLQELPKPLNKLTWDNAALISPATAATLHLDDGDMVELKYGGRTLQTPVWRVPGHPDDCVTLSLGYGRQRAGRVGNGTGFNAYTLRTAAAPWSGAGLEMTKSGGSYPLATTQRHHLLKEISSEGEEAARRGLVRVGTLDEFVKDPKKPEFMGEREPESELPSLYPPMWPSDRTAVEQGDAATRDIGRYDARGYDNNPIPAWGMAIDTNACIGCNACVLACQSENNIATVGKDQVMNMRQMHWIRIDTYHTGSPENPETVFEPLPCMHCEKAPCEPVCPVEATSHSAEGINEQTYNRCVGTRYCQNNCPYKVRHFNYFQYSDQQTPSIQMMRNPDVTVRSRGVMEKCTYCVQRVNEARIQAEREDRPIRDGDIQTACAQVCPTEAITFGNINDTASNSGRGSQVRQLKLEPLHFALLTELNTRPRTSYLAKLKNLNPELKA